MAGVDGAITVEGEAHGLEFPARTVLGTGSALTGGSVIVCTCCCTGLGGGSVVGAGAGVGAWMFSATTAVCTGAGFGSICAFSTGVMDGPAASGFGKATAPSFSRRLNKNVPTAR